jgi:hypothetical protein
MHKRELRTQQGLFHENMTRVSYSAKARS